MNVSMKWLSELVDARIDSQELARLYSLRSAEVARLEKLVEATELTIGHVLTCEMHPDSDHLHVCSVDVGTQTLQIICGAPNVEVDKKSS
ncbi:MAG: hypothetical protein AB7S88_00565 [Candidatus Izemoplasmatales bacterium]